MLNFLKKKLRKNEEDELKAAAHQELGKARALVEQTELAKIELRKALEQAQEIIEQRVGKVSKENGPNPTDL